MTQHIKKELASSLENIAKSYAPLPALSPRHGINEEDVLRLFIAMASPECPQLVDFSNFGFTLEIFRKFLSLYAGQTLVIPKLKVWQRIWYELTVWLAVEEVRRSGVSGTGELDLPVIFKQVATRYKVSSKFVEYSYTRLAQGFSLITKGKSER